MRWAGFQEVWRSGAERASLPQSRAFGSARLTIAQRFAGVLSPESLFRLVLAFLLATALWLYVNSRNAPDVTFTLQQPIPIAAVHVGKNLTVLNHLGGVHVSVRSSAIGTQITPSTFAASVNVSGLGAGSHRLPVHLSAADPTIPVASFTPRAIKVVISRAVENTVPVQLHVAGAPPYGYALVHNGLVAHPSFITVSGSKAFVEQVATAAVFVDLSSKRRSFTARYPIVLENGQGSRVKSPLRASQSSVRVSAILQQLASFKLVPILPTIQGEPAPGFGIVSIQTAPPGLTLYGSPKALHSINNLRTSPISVDGHRAGRRTQWVNLSVPRGVYAGRDHVKVTVTVGPVVGAASTRIAVHYVHLAPGLSATVSPSTVLVTIVGQSPALARETGKIRAVVDLSGLRAGTYQLLPQVYGTQHIRVDSVSPSRVAVSIH